MTSLVQKIQWVYPELTMSDFLDTIQVVVNDEGERIAVWDHPTLLQPTQAQLDAATEPPPSPAVVQQAVVDAVQKRLDDFARTRQYDSILSACSYSTSKNAKFGAEGQCCVDARDTHWAKCYEIMSAVQAGTRPMPTVEEVLAEMPALMWPEVTQ